MPDWHKFFKDTLKTRNSEAITYDEFCRMLQAKGSVFSASGKLSSVVKSKMLFAIAQVFDQLIKMDFMLSNNRARINN